MGVCTGAAVVQPIEKCFPICHCKLMGVWGGVSIPSPEFESVVDGWQWVYALEQMFLKAQKDKQPSLSLNQRTLQSQTLPQPLNVSSVSKNFPWPETPDEATETFTEEEQQHGPKGPIYKLAK